MLDFKSGSGFNVYIAFTSLPGSASTSPALKCMPCGDVDDIATSLMNSTEKAIYGKQPTAVMENVEDMCDAHVRKLVGDCCGELGKERGHHLGTQSSVSSSPASSFGPLGSVILVPGGSDGGMVGAVVQGRVRPAMDSGACDNAIDPADVPNGRVVLPHTTGKYFRGANGSVIEKLGDAATVLESDLGAIGCTWEAAGV